MTCARFLLVVTLPLLLCWTAAAEPSLLGLSGLMLSPTVDILPEGAWNIGLNTSELEDFETVNYYGNYGIGSNTEVGLLLLRADLSVKDKAVKRRTDETFLSIKRAFILPEGNKPGFAVGVFDITDEVETTVFAVATWELGRQVGEVDGRALHLLNLHAGFGSGQLEDLFFGARARLGDKVELMGEHVDGDWNVGARARPVRGLTVDAGFIDLQDLALNVSYGQGF